MHLLNCKIYYQDTIRLFSQKTLTVVLSGSYMSELGHTQTSLDPLRIIAMIQICDVLFLYLASCDSLLFFCVYFMFFF